ncbi:MAG: class I SAM-dependent methyltransferase [Syntrophorhabdaceae bacterium]|nr:class I SAM-dependent methyltransferase [Syntrophorhabdaceae bacterium]
MSEKRSCYLCENRKFKKRDGKVRDKPELEILECTECGLVFLSSFDHISDDFYEDSSMHENDISIEGWLRETTCDDERRVEYLARTIENKHVLDFGCGNGGFIMRARDYAAIIEGVEVERRLDPHFKKNSLTVYKSLGEINKKFDVITAFHVIEHIKDPAGLLKNLATLLRENGIIIIEVPNSNDALLTLYKCKAFSEFTYWSCHLFLFNNETIKLLIKKAGLRLLYIKQVQRYPLSNHLYWLSCGKPGGHQKWNFLDSDTLNDEYEKQLSSIGCCDTIIVGISR